MAENSALNPDFGGKVTLIYAIVFGSHIHFREVEVTRKDNLWIGFSAAAITFVCLVVATGHLFYETMLYQYAQTTVGKQEMMLDGVWLIGMVALCGVFYELASSLLQRIKQGPDHIFIELTKD